MINDYFFASFFWSHQNHAIFTISSHYWFPVSAVSLFSFLHIDCLGIYNVKIIVWREVKRVSCKHLYQTPYFTFHQKWKCCPRCFKQQKESNFTLMEKIPYPIVTQILTNVWNFSAISIASFNAAPVYNSYILIFCKWKHNWPYTSIPFH